MKASLLYPSIVEAVQKAAQSVGIPNLAAEMDMRPSSLYNVLNPYGDRSVTKLGLEATLFIMLRSGDITPLEMMASELGYSLKRNETPESEKDSIEAECCDDMDALAQFSRFVRSKDVFPLPKPLDIITLAGRAKDEIDQTAHLWLSRWKDRQ